MTQPDYKNEDVLDTEPEQPFPIGSKVLVKRWGYGIVRGFWQNFIIVHTDEFGATGCTGGFPAERLISA